MNCQLKKRIHVLLLFLFSSLFLSVNAQSWQDVGGGTNNSSHCMTLWNGKLINGGSFNNPCNRVASWNDTVWNCFGGGAGIVVRDAIDFNGELVVCGDFWNVQQPCVGCNGIAKWNGTSWTPLGTGFNNDVLCLTIWNGELVAGGDFTQADGNPVSRIARWNGTQWVGIGGTSDFSNDIRTMTVYDGELWVGGDFNNVGGCTACDGVVKWTGSAWVGGDSGVDITGGVDSTVRVLYVDPSTNLLYLGGHFIELNLDGVINTDCNGIAVYDGSDWAPLGTGVNSYVRAITTYNGNIIAGGDFNMAGATTANKIAKWNPTTSTWYAMGTGMNDYVKSAAVYNGSLYAGGPFTTADGLTRNRIAKWYEAPVIPPTAAINASATSTCAGQCINFSDNSANSPTAWTWNFPGGTPSNSTNQNPGSVCFNSAGTYAVTLTACNSNGCNTTTQTITVSNIPSVAVNNLTLCNGQSGNLNATGAATYTWSPAAGLSATTGPTVVANPTVTTTYTVTGTSAGGCTNTATATVTINSLPTASATNNGPYCAGETIQLNSISGSPTDDWTGPNSYSQNNMQNPSIINATVGMGGLYTVTVTNAAGCTATATTNVTVNSLPAAVSSNTGPYCIGSTIQLNSSGGTGYAWAGPLSFSSTNQNPTIPSASISMSGNYTVTVTNAAGCSTTSTTMVSVNTFPTPTASNTGPYCEGDSVQLNGTGGGTYSWMGPAGFSSNLQDPIISPATTLMNGIYTVTVTLAGGCSASTTTTITVNTNPIVTANSFNICQGGLDTLFAAGATSFAWSPPIGLSATTGVMVIANPTTTTSYTVTGTTGSCSGTALATVTINSTPEDSISANGPTTFCNGNSVILTASAGDNYLWNTSEITSSILVTNSGTYSVQVTNNNGCSATSSITITVDALPDVTISITGITITANQSSAAYQWVDCNNNFAYVPGETGQNFTPSVNGNYAVIVELNGCIDTSACQLISNVGVGPITYQSNLIVYPNPSSEFIHFGTIQSGIMNIYDIYGRSLIATVLPEGNQKIYIGDLSSGIYFIELTTPKGSITTRFIRQ